MSNIPSNIDTLTDAVDSTVVATSPSSKNSDDKELSWSNVEDTDEDIPSPQAAVVQNELSVVEEQPVVEEKLAVEEQPVEKLAEKPVVEEQPVEKPVVEEQPAEQLAEKPIPSLTIDESSSDEMPPLVSDESGDDDMPQLVSSSDESSDEESDDESSDEESDEEMPELVSDDDDIVHMLIRDVNCSRCRTAIQTLLSHDHDSPNRVDEECNTFHPKNEFPPIITHILWLFVTLHALNLLSTWYNM
jgi:hypothetical protein